MNVFPYARFRSRVFPLVVVVLVAALCRLYVAPAESQPSSPERPLDNSRLAVEQEELALQSKAERLLKGLGEESPVVVVTITYEYGKKVVHHTLPSSQTQVVQSRKTSSESLDKEDGENRYLLTKDDAEYALEVTETSLTTEQPRVARVDCVVKISRNHSARQFEIEQALRVALGMDVQRGDQLMVLTR